jgi:uncharacterized membrane protein
MSRIEKNALWLTSFFYVGVGISHFIAVDFLVEIIPDVLPAKELLVYLTGFIEILLGLALLNNKTRKQSAWLILTMLVVYLWVHIDMLIQKDYFIDTLNLTNYISNPDIFFYGRIVLQFVIIYWILAFTKDN